MIRRYGLAGIALALSIAGLAPAQGPVKVTPGLWEITTQITDMQMEGLPSGMSPEMMKQMRPPARTVRSCITPQQAAKPEASMLAAQKDGQCKVEKMDMSGGKVAIAMVCGNAQRGTLASIGMTGQYTPTSYTMDGTVKADGARGMKMTMKSHTTGKRVGACKG